MKAIHVLGILAIVCIVLQSGVRASADASTVEATPFAVDGSGAPAAGGARLDCLFDLGVVDPDKSAKVEHIFKLKNVTQRGVAVTDLSTGCRCTMASLSMGYRQLAVPCLIAPGDTVDVTVDIASIALEAGENSKSVWLYVDGKNQPAVMLTLQAEVADTGPASPTVLDFGKIAYGNERMLSFIVRPLPGNPNAVLTPELAKPDGHFVLARLPNVGPAVTYNLTFRPGSAAGAMDNEILIRSSIQGTVAGKVAVHAQAVGIVSSNSTISGAQPVNMPH